MKEDKFDKKVAKMFEAHEKFLSQKNQKEEQDNGIYTRYMNPAISALHAPVHWRYDLDYKTNPMLLQRIGVNAAFNAGAIELNGKFYMLVRAEGWDRKSFFAVAESPNGVDNFRFWDYPVSMPETAEPDVNVYDMRLTKHEDGWIYGVFCTERKDPNAPAGDLSSAIAQCGIARTKDLKTWVRLDDLKTPSPQQRNCVLHPEFVDGKYAFYTRPQDDFINPGSGGGIGWGLADDIEHAVISEETVIEHRAYHTVKELKNGQGPAPIKTDIGWIHLAHGVRNTAAGMRYVLYVFLTALNEPWKVIKQPGGYFIAPEGDERIGDVSNVAFSNGWIARDNGDVYIYYGASDTRMNVATSTIKKLMDYVQNTPEDPMRSAACVEQRKAMIQKNLEIMKKKKWRK